MAFRPRDPVDDITYEVIGAAVDVHRTLGPGFLESVYQAAMETELALRGIPFERQKSVPLQYKGARIGEHRLDLLVAEMVVVELKAVDALAPIHVAQMISYLVATGLRHGLLINFQVNLLKQGIRRIVR